MITLIIALAIAYCIGSISFSIIYAKISGGADPRETGSKNAGTTNMLRTAGKSAAIIVLIGDIAKGVIAVLMGKVLGLTGFNLGLVAFAAVAGHIFPVFFGFRGGKGVATAIGTLFGLSLLLFIIGVAVFIAVALLTRYASLASLTALLAATIASLFISTSYFIPLLLILALIVIKHLPNIQRLKNGEENKIRL
jgi:glycerol-3-phosphate acyltransferase PlsY